MKTDRKEAIAPPASDEFVVVRSQVENRSFPSAPIRLTQLGPFAALRGKPIIGGANVVQWFHGYFGRARERK